MAWHYLRKNKATWCPTQCAALVVSTADCPVPGTAKQWERVLKSWHLLRWRRGKSGVSRVEESVGSEPDGLWAGVANILQPSRPVWLFSNDLRTALTVTDFWGLVDREVFSLGAIPESRKHGCLVTGQPPSIVSALRVSDGARLICLDLHNYSDDTSWSGLARSLGSGPLGSPAEPWDPDRLELECGERCWLLGNWVEEYIRWVLDHDLGMFRLTVGGQALAAYRHRFINHEIVIHDDVPVKKVEQSCVYSGQVSSFFFGQPGVAIIQLDCNSLYPFVMKNNLYPCKLLGVTDAGSDGSWGCPDSPHELIAKVTLSSDSFTYPCRMEGRTRWVRGEFTTVLAGPELCRAVYLGHVTKWLWWARYELADLFSGYVDYLWSLRQQYRTELKPIYETIVKKLLNSLWGKFAQRNPEWIPRPDVIPWDNWCEWVVSDTVSGVSHHYRACSGTVQECCRERGWPSWSFPAVAAFVTAYGREHMLGLREVAGERQVYYQGCDSICCSVKGADRLRVAGLVNLQQLGALREVTRSDDCEFCGANFYRIGSHAVTSGVGSDAVHVRQFDYEQSSLESLHTIVSRPPSGSVLVRRGRLSMRPRLPDGQIGPDGWVSPTILP